MVDLIDEITKVLIDEEKYAVSLFLDLSKAFDTINYILVSKLDLYGLQGNEDQWFRSCRGKRKQKGFVSGVESNFLLLIKLRSTTRGNSRSSSPSYLD